MFDTYNGGDISHSVKINACSGGIYKTYPESWFEQFHIDSKLAEALFRKEKCFYNKSTNKYSSDKYSLMPVYYSGSDDEDICEVVILQMIICGEEKVLAEIITKEDFERNLKLEIKEE
jgi:hypothetical protein